MNHVSPSNGFTLIETIIYIALFSIIIEGALGAVAAIHASAARSEAHAYLVFEGMFLEDKVAYALQDAESIALPQIEGTSTILSTTARHGTAVTMRFVNQQMLVARGSHEEVPLTGRRVIVQDGAFVRAAGADAITTSFTLATHTSAGQLVQQSFSRITYVSP